MLLMNHEFHENLSFKNNNTFTVPVLHFNMEVVGSSILLNTSIYYFCQIFFIHSDMYCFLGYQPYGNEIQTFQKLPYDRKLISKIFPSDQISMQMVTLR